MRKTIGINDLEGFGILHQDRLEWFGRFAQAHERAIELLRQGWLVTVFLKDSFAPVWKYGEPLPR